MTMLLWTCWDFVPIKQKLIKEAISDVFFAI